MLQFQTPRFYPRPLLMETQLCTVGREYRTRSQIQAVEMGFHCSMESEKEVYHKGYGDRVATTTTTEKSQCKVV